MAQKPDAPDTGLAVCSIPLPPITQANRNERNVGHYARMSHVLKAGGALQHHILKRILRTIMILCPCVHAGRNVFC